MPKLTFPSVVTSAYAWMIGYIRQELNEFSTFLYKSPGAKADVANQVNAFMNQNGLTHVVPSTQLVVTSGVKVLGPAITGSYVNGYTLTIVGGVVTAIVAS